MMARGEDNDRLLTITEAALQIGVNRATLYRWLRAGRLPAYKLASNTLRVRLVDLREFVESRQYAPKTTKERRHRMSLVRRGISPLWAAKHELKEKVHGNDGPN